MQKSLHSVVIVGAGNMAGHLGCALFNAGLNILEVVNRSKNNGLELAQKLHADFNQDFTTTNTTADIYILAVSDDSIEKVAASLPLKHQLLVHTSGSVPLDVLHPYSENTGVLYPLQSLNKNRNTDFKSIPVCIESGRPENLNLLKTLALSLSERVYELNSQARMAAHVAAVFASNFSNHMYALSSRILSQYGLPFELIRPLITETAQRMMDQMPGESQTGPAMREDMNTIDKHLDLLKDMPDAGEIYKIISESIIQNKNN